MTTWIKICGITRNADADAVVNAGADALGLVFVPGTPRAVCVERAHEIAARVRGQVRRVGLFMDPDREAVQRVLDAVELDALQFHGGEPASFCRSFGLPYVKTVKVRAPLRLPALETDYHDACCLLLDTFVEGVPGGSGVTFDWGLWPASSTLPLVLAGGLTPENVAGAVQRLRPWGVDVSGGVEGACKGEKDRGRIQAFVAEVKRAGS
ncbi:MAG: phosphoribosylanthranilate isomerase [Pseudomonadota bacterium]